MSDDEEYVRQETAKSLGALAESRTFNSEKINKIREILKNEYKIKEEELVYSYQILLNLLKEKEDLGQFVLRYLPEYQAIKEFSKEISSELTDDKKTEDVEKFWQENQLSLASLQSFNLELST